MTLTYEDAYGDPHRDADGGAGPNPDLDAALNPAANSALNPGPNPDANLAPDLNPDPDPNPYQETHRVITPSILYFGTPVEVLSTENADGTANLAPMSSAWALHDIFLLGLGASGHTVRNLRDRPELVINFPSPDQWARVDRLGLLTGTDPVPAGKPPGCRFEPDKFAAAGWHPAPADLVRPPRVAECPVQIEARVSSLRPDASGRFVIVEAAALRVHAHPAITVDGTSHVDPAAWSPLIYNFRHYFGLGPEAGRSRRAEY